MNINKKNEESELLIQAIHKLMEWLESLLDENNIQFKTTSINSKRIFSSEECACLSLESRNYLLKLEEQGVLTPILRERIIHHAMLLDIKTIELPIVEGITHILLGQYPEMVDTLSQMRKLMSVSSRVIH